MKILVIGGSYFYGRVFCMLAAKEHEITVVNRGTYSMEKFGVRQVRGERHDAALWRSLDGNYGAIVDFCAYEPGDISLALENLKGSVAQYLLVSTVDVYERGTGVVKDEDTSFETRAFPGEAGAYIAGKAALEKELWEECSGRGIAFTVLRPAILYGPYNYAPRESLFIQLAVQRHLLPRFTDADGRFQFVYVKDAAEALLRCLGNEKAYGQAYNLCGDEVLDYDMFFRALEDAAREAGGKTQQPQDGNTTGEGIRELPMTLAEAGEKGVPVPFPATAAETELVSNEKSKSELGMVYTSLESGMKKTYTAFSHVYGG